MCLVFLLDQKQQHNHSIRLWEGPFRPNVQFHQKHYLVRPCSNWYMLLEGYRHQQSRHLLVFHQRYQARDPSLIVYQQDWRRMYFVRNFLELEGEHMKHQLYREHELAKYCEVHREFCSRHVQNWCLGSGSQMELGIFLRMLELLFYLTWFSILFKF